MILDAITLVLRVFAYMAGGFLATAGVLYALVVPVLYAVGELEERRRIYARRFKDGNAYRKALVVCRFVVSLIVAPLAVAVVGAIMVELAK